MSVLIPLLLLVGALCVLDLLLTLGVIRRLREHSDLLAAPGGPGTVPVAPEVGTPIGEFSVETTTGERLTDADLAEGALVAFFSPTCGPCRTKLPKFVEHVAALPRGRNGALAVVVGEPEESADFVRRLSAVTRTVRESSGGALAGAFQAQAFPTLLTVGRPAGRLAVTANDVALAPSVPVAV
ncbi:TlpA family protein disulfide reductase [Kitasatospora sp. NPDC092039]|uniref:TlpA family protein disulfide reductase n=1 Tax=Kitasatospora sp. NPDC092039 TaxID=3364086 RepID=UPI0038263455